MTWQFSFNIFLQLSDRSERGQRVGFLRVGSSFFINKRCLFIYLSYIV